jgi:hypothetical protein
MVPDDDVDAVGAAWVPGAVLDEPDQAVWSGPDEPSIRGEVSDKLHKVYDMGARSDELDDAGAQSDEANEAEVVSDEGGITSDEAEGV